VTEKLVVGILRARPSEVEADAPVGARRVRVAPPLDRLDVDAFDARPPFSGLSV